MIFAFWQTLLLQFSFFVLQRLMRGKPQQQKAKAITAGDLNLPRAEEGSGVPLFWGQVLVRAPNLIWWGQLKTTTQGGASNITGEAIQLSLDFAIGLPADDGATPSRLHAIRIDERPIPGQTFVNGPIAGDDLNNIHGAGSLTFWGPVEANGELAGSFEFYNGAFDQTYKDNGGTTPGDAGLPLVAFREESALDETMLPTYRGIARVFFKDVKLGRNLTLPAFAFEVSTFPNRLSLASAPTYPLGGHRIPAGGGHDANPAEVLYDILTNPWGRLGMPTDRLDSTSFQTAGDTLAEELHGFSFVAYNAVDARELTQEILEEIDGIMYEDPETRTIKLKLIRDDYAVGNLDLYDESNVERVEKFATSTWEQTYNQVRVNYTDRRANYATRAQFAQDGAHIAASGEQPRTAQFNYPGVSNADLANRVAARELNALSRPLAQVTVVVNRDGYTLRPGDVFRFSWADLGITDMVLRVQRFSLGTMENNEIRLKCVEDRFAVDHTVFEPNPDPINPPLFTPAVPITDRVLVELPRWLGHRASTTPQTRDVVDAAEDPHVLYLAKNPGDSLTFRAEISSDGGVTYLGEIDHTPFARHATVAAVIYLRSWDPYDITTGLEIENVTSPSVLGSASVSDIEDKGRNLALVGPDGGPYELVAYEAVAILGGGKYRLQSVWRGLLDTVPVQHNFGEHVWLFDADDLLTENVGAIEWVGDESLEARLLTRSAIDMLSPENAPIIDLTLQARATRTYPVADMEVEGAKFYVAEDQDTIDVTWKRRDKDSTTIVRGDAADETPPDSPQQYIEIRDRGSEDSWQTLSGPINTTSDTVDLGPYGAGDAEVRVRSTSQPGSTELDGIQHPVIGVDARHYRQLLVDPDAPDSSAWTVNSGAVTSTTDRGRRFAHADSSADLEVEQARDVSGYPPGDLTARLSFLVSKQRTDADDTLEVRLETLDEADDVLQDAVYGPITPSPVLPAADLEVLTLLCHEDTKKIRVRYFAVNSGGGETVGAVAEFDLRLGSLSSQQLSNNEFETGGSPPSGWSEDTSGSSVIKSGAFDGFYPFSGDQCVEGGSNTNNEIYQEATLDEYRYAAVIWYWWQGQSFTVDRMQTVLEARDASSVLETQQTADEENDAQDTWYKRSLYIDALPDGTTKLRCRLTSTKLAGSFANNNWDALHVYLCQEPNSSWIHTIDFSTPNGVGTIPTTRQGWRDTYDEDVVPIPNLGWWTGGALTGLAGVEPTMTAEGSTRTNVTGKGWNPDPFAEQVKCFELDRDTDAIVSSSTAFANFDKSTSFSIFMALKSKQEVTGGGLIGRSGAFDEGWQVSLVSSTPQFFISDSAFNSASVTGAVNILDGAPHGFVFGYDAGTDEIFIRDEQGESRVDASGVGDLSVDDLLFRIGTYSGSASTLAAHVAAVYMWTDTVIDATMYAALWHYGDNPTSDTLAVTRTGTIATISAVNGSDEEIARFSDDQIAWGYNGEHGLVCSQAFDNEAPTSDPNNATYWTALGGATVQNEYGADMEGFVKAVAIETDNTIADGYELDSISLGLSAASSVWVGLGVRSKDGGASHDFEAELFTSGGVSKGSLSGTATSDWTWTWLQFTGWDGATATASLRIRGSDDGTTRGIEISGPIAVVIDAVKPQAWPISRNGTGGATTDIETTITGLSIPKRFANEGELRVRGIAPADAEGQASLAKLENGVDNVELRRMDINVTSLFAQHRDGSGGFASASASDASIDSGQSFVARLRWNRAQIYGGGSNFADVIFEGNVTASATIRSAKPSHEPDHGLNELYLGNDPFPWTGLIHEVQLRAREGR